MMWLCPPCLYCGHSSEETDHIVARSRGGGDEPQNLAPACRSCNSAKGSFLVEHFLRQHLDVLARVYAYQAGENVLSGLTPGEKPRAKHVKGETVALTVRVSRADWARLHQLAVARDVSLQTLAISGLSAELGKEGLPALIPVASRIRP